LAEPPSLYPCRASRDPGSVSSTSRSREGQQPQTWTSAKSLEAPSKHLAFGAGNAVARCDRASGVPALPAPHKPSLTQFDFSASFGRRDTETLVSPLIAWPCSCRNRPAIASGVRREWARPRPPLDARPAQPSDGERTQWPFVPVHRVCILAWLIVMSACPPSSMVKRGDPTSINARNLHAIITCCRIGVPQAGNLPPYHTNKLRPCATCTFSSLFPSPVTHTHTHTPVFPPLPPLIHSYTSQAFAVCSGQVTKRPRLATIQLVMPNEPGVGA